MKTPAKPKSARRPYMVAMVLGTALSTFGPSAGAAEAPETSQAVHDISRYCTACWRNARLHPDCWTDCTQEVFSRLMERVSPGSWRLALQGEGDERREFLRAIDAVKKRTQRGRKWSSAGVEDLADRHGPEACRVREDWQAVREASAALLSPRQQDILQLSFEGWSVHDISGKLRLSPERVSDEKYKAIRKLREHFNAEAQANG